MFHIGYFKVTVKTLQCICKTCSRVLLPAEDRARLIRCGPKVWSWGIVQSLDDQDLTTLQIGILACWAQMFGGTVHLCETQCRMVGLGLMKLSFMVSIWERSISRAQAPLIK